MSRSPCALAGPGVFTEAVFAGGERGTRTPSTARVEVRAPSVAGGGGMWSVSTGAEPFEAAWRGAAAEPVTAEAKERNVRHRQIVSAGEHCRLDVPELAVDHRSEAVDAVLLAAATADGRLGRLTVQVGTLRSDAVTEVLVH